MTDLAKSLRNEYVKDWRTKNKDKIAEQNRRYRKKHPEVIKQCKERYWERKANAMINQSEGKPIVYDFNDIAWLLSNSHFRTLNANSQLLFLTFIKEADGKSSFIFPLSVAESYKYNSTTFRRSVNELCSNGFIRIVYSGRAEHKVNIYEFSHEFLSST